MRYPEHDRASMRSSALEVTFSFQPRNGRRNGNHPQDDDRTIEPGNVPRLSKLMALAIRFDGLVRGGEVRDYADLARLGYVTPVPPPHGQGPRPDPRERRPTHCRYSTLAPPAQDVEEADQ